MIKLIVGLGNPTSEYLKTRHNIGFMFNDKILENSIISKYISIKNGFLCKIKLDLANDIYLLKPNTFMNDSGVAIEEVCNLLNITPEEILVIHDEIHFKSNKFSLKFAGSSGGNNGLKSIISKIGEDFWRLRIGVDKPEDNSQLLNWVLSNPNEEDLNNILNNFKIILSDLSLLCIEPNKFQLKYNKK